MMTRLKNMPPIMPTRAVISFLAEPAVCMPVATAMMETRLARAMARMVYQAYSLVAADPKRLNMKSGTAACKPAKPPTRCRAIGMSRSENVVRRNPWMTSVMAAARNPPIIV